MLCAWCMHAMSVEMACHKVWLQVSNEAMHASRCTCVGCLYALLCTCAQEVCRDAASFDVRAEDLAACMEELHKAAEVAAARRDQVLVQAAAYSFMPTPRRCLPKGHPCTDLPSHPLLSLSEGLHLPAQVM